jgi:hypothetical protein
VNTLSIFSLKDEPKGKRILRLLSKNCVGARMGSRGRGGD